MMERISSRGVSASYAGCSRERLRIRRVPEGNKVRTEDEWVNEWMFGKHFKTLEIMNRSYYAIDETFSKNALLNAPISRIIDRN